MSKGLTSEQVSDLLSQVIRVGVVTARQPEKLRVQVECRDTVTDSLVTDWVQVLVPRAKEDKQYDIPDIGDQVLCLFQPFGRERGFVLGSMYAAEEPPVADGDKSHRTFKDGTTLEYDRNTHEYVHNVNPGGSILLRVGASQIKITGDKILIQSPLVDINP